MFFASLETLFGRNKFAPYGLALFKGSVISATKTNYFGSHFEQLSLVSTNVSGSKGSVSVSSYAGGKIYGKHRISNSARFFGSNAFKSFCRWFDTTSNRNVLKSLVIAFGVPLTRPPYFLPFILQR